MVAISIMTLIVLVLYGVFDQVQKALRGNAAQVDVLEGGRAAMELMTRELEQARALNLPGQTNLYVGLTAKTNVQELLETDVYRTNVLQEVFFVSQFNKQWTGIGYRILASSPFTGKPDIFAEGVGTLTRYSTNLHQSDLIRGTNLLAPVMDRQTASLARYQQVTDGVVHFRIRAYDRLGQLMTYRTNNYSGVIMFNDRFSGETGYTFFTNGLPAYLELEMGVLEPQIVERWRGIPNPVVASNFLAKQTGKVHLFQQRIPIRTAQ